MGGSGGVNIDVSQSWTYIVCQYYPLQEVAVPLNNLLSPYATTGPVPVCNKRDWQSSRFNQTSGEWQKYLSTDTQTLDRTRRLLILQGGYDRVAGIGMPKLTLSNNREHSRVMFTEGRLRLLFHIA